MSFVQSAAGSATSGSTVAATFAAGTAAGNTIIVCVSNQSSQTVSSISPAGFTKAVAVLEGTFGEDAEIWALVDSAGGHTTITVTFSGTITDAEINIIEWSGISSATADKTNSGSSASGVTSWSSGSSGTLTQASEVAFGVVAVNSEGSGADTLTGPGSFTNLAQINAGTGISQLAGYKQVSSTIALTYNGTSSVSVAYAAAIATFKLTAVAAPAPFTPPRVGLRGQPGRRGRVTGPGLGLSSRGAPRSPTPAMFIAPRVALRGQPGRPGRVVGPGLFSRGAPYMPTPAPFTPPRVGLRGQPGRRGRVTGPGLGLSSRGAPYKPHKTLLISLASAAGIDDYGNSFPEGILATAGIIEGPTLIGSNAFYYNPAPAFGNLIASLTEGTGTDAYGNAYLGGQTSYNTGGGLVFAISNTGGSISFWTASTFAGPWTFYGEIEILPSTPGELILNFASVTGVMTIPQAAVSGFPLPTDANSGSTWVSGERAFMNNSWITPLNNLYSALVAAGIIV